ncbi:uncharacterized protein LOC126734915 isoform X2 [Anthonomus grandis grandis]|nr:uncharacterized protein LOC126734915 isoform X2 [Anthonomus grandis grandis]XP_050294711.1 uncharacterized protein LOC126734915 isoform X2 [Anthonomus grandis grandis]XP_050294712.1 uncharacterized protein LOC126734915 isoform X2 [Anthonomus grandis grandis]
MPIGRCYTADICSGYSIIDCVRKAMKGRIINCSPHQDIYFLETHNAKNEESNLENLFVSPAGREMLKYTKPGAKLKQKINPNLEFLTTIHNPAKVSQRQSRELQCTNKPPTIATKCEIAGECSTSNVVVPSTSTSTVNDVTNTKSSLDLYEEAAAILGLSCSQTDDCRCIECQCHYFDFEEEIDFPTSGNDYGKLIGVEHTSSCSIQ